MEESFKKRIKKSIPLRELQFFYEKITGQRLSPYISKNQIIEEIADIQEKYPDILKDLTNLSIRFQFAGRGAVSWSIPVNGFPLNKNSITECIKGIYGEDIFSKENEPPLSTTPELNKTEWLRDDLLKLEFAYKEKSFLIEQDYEIKEVTPTRRLIALIRILNSPIVVECRANFNKSRILHRKISRILGIKSKIIDFSEKDIEDLKILLNANKKAAKHKKSAGDFDTMEVTVSPHISDLDSGSEYNELLGGDELKYARYEFSVPYENKTENKITFNISRRGSIWFMSEIPEGVIEYVFSKVREIKQI